MENKRFDVRHGLRCAYIALTTGEEALIATDEKTGKLIWRFPFTQDVRNANVNYSKIINGETQHILDLSELLQLEQKYVKLLLDAKGGK